MDFKKIIYLLKQLYETNHKEDFVEMVTFSDFKFTRHQNTSLPLDWHVYNLTIHLQHEIFLKNYSLLSIRSDIIKSDLQRISNLQIDKVKVLPDYDKFQVIDSAILPIFTIWEEINFAQAKLISALQNSNDQMDFQNVGMISRVILEKLAQQVFDDKKHTTNPENLNISKYKNQLLIYIKSELSGSSNEYLRKFAKSLIKTVQNSIDLANSVTHKLDGERLYAETCALGTINAINIIKQIEAKR